MKSLEERGIILFIAGRVVASFIPPSCFSLSSANVEGVTDADLVSSFLAGSEGPEDCEGHKSGLSSGGHLA